jgi:nicotinate-nucleotide adenylyltransferase
LNAPKKIGILGGTFDPPHLGHLKLATHFAKLFSLDELLLIPSGEPWQKAAHITRAETRLQLTKAAAIDLAKAFLYLQIPTQVGVDRLEVDRAGPSYAIDTIKTLRGRYGPTASLIWLMGADSFMSVPSWNSWRELLNQVHFAVANRPECVLETEMGLEIRDLLTKRQTLEAGAIENSPSGRIYLDKTLAVDLSSTDLRNRLRTPSGNSLGPEQIPSHVLEIITNLGLYK